MQSGGQTGGQIDRRRKPINASFLSRTGIAWLVVGALLVAVNWTGFLTWRFPDPDDTMRLLQVRDLIGGQGWFDTTQYRVDAPGGGVPMHWSRIVDLPLVLVIVLLTPIVGAAAAESAALIIVPLLTLGTAMLLTARIAWRLLGDEEATITALIMAVSVSVIFQLTPMRIDHHGWQLVCALVAMNGLMARSPVVGGRVIGASLAVWLSISIEGLPLAAAIFAVIGLRWLRDRSERAILVSAIQTLAFVSALCFVGTRGLSDLAAHCDAINPVHLGMFVWGALTLTLLSRWEPLPLALRLGGFAIAGGGALSMLVFSSPECVVGGGFAELDPLVHDYWYVNVSEGMPIWHQSLKVGLQYGITPVFGLFAAILLAARSQDWLRQFWTDYALILGAAFLVSLLVSRAGAVACVIAAPPLAWWINDWLTRARKFERPLPRFAVLLGVALVLLPTLPLDVSKAVGPAFANSDSKSRSNSAAGAPGHLKMSDCRIEQNAAILGALEPGEIFAPLDIAPRLMLFSANSVPATGHHRGNATMRVVIATALGSTIDAKATLSRRGSKYLALCPNLVEAKNYAYSAPDGFFADLRGGRVPDWLEPVETARGTSLKLWRVRAD